MKENRFHIVMHLERSCSKCGKILSMRIYDYGVLTYTELDNKIGHMNFEIRKIKCSNCGIKEWPDDIVIYNIADDGKMEQVVRKRIGSEEMPVVDNNGNNTHYAVTMSAEEDMVYQRGLAKVKDIYEENKDRFWKDYCQFALNKWHRMIGEVNLEEFIRGYQELHLPLLSSNQNAAAYRRDLEKRASTDDLKCTFWQALNRYLVEKEFIWVPIDTWGMKEWVKKYGRERVVYLTLNIPLPEELEPWRTKMLGKVVKKRTGEAGVFFERIGQLSWELEKQRNRAVALGRELSNVRQENAVLAEQVGKLKLKIQQLKESKPRVIDRKQDDVRKIRQLKGLVRELREEVERLAALLPAPAEEVPLEIKDQVSLQNTSDVSVLAGKSILIVGWPKGSLEYEKISIIWHDGDSVNSELQEKANRADIYVVLTRFCSHAAMWWLKETAIDDNKPVLFVRETNVNRILEIAAKKVNVKE